MLNQKPKITTSKKLHTGKKEKEVYTQIWSTQQAINMAVAEQRVIRFKTEKSNKEIKREIDDLRNCSLRKPDKYSNEVAVIPPGIEDFCFEEDIDESIDIKSRIVIPRPIIYKP